jgi:hypothetical protein
MSNGIETINVFGVVVSSNGGMNQIANDNKPSPPRSLSRRNRREEVSDD